MKGSRTSNTRQEGINEKGGAGDIYRFTTLQLRDDLNTWWLKCDRLLRNWNRKLSMLTWIYPGQFDWKYTCNTLSHVGCLYSDISQSPRVNTLSQKSLILGPLTTLITRNALNIILNTMRPKQALLAIPREHFEPPAVRTCLTYDVWTLSSRQVPNAQMKDKCELPCCIRNLFPESLRRGLVADWV